MDEYKPRVFQWLHRIHSDFRIAGHQSQDLEVNLARCIEKISRLRSGTLSLVPWTNKELLISVIPSLDLGNVFFKGEDMVGAGIF